MRIKTEEILQNNDEFITTGVNDGIEINSYFDAHKRIKKILYQDLAPNSRLNWQHNSLMETDLIKSSENALKIFEQYTQEGVILNLNFYGEPEQQVKFKCLIKIEVIQKNYIMKTLIFDLYEEEQFFYSRQPTIIKNEIIIKLDSNQLVEKIDDKDKNMFSKKMVIFNEEEDINENKSENLSENIIFGNEAENSVFKTPESFADEFPIDIEYENHKIDRQLFTENEPLKPSARGIDFGNKLAISDIDTSKKLNKERVAKPSIEILNRKQSESHMSKDEKIGKLVIPVEKEYDELHKNSNGSISSHGSHVIWTKLEMALFEEYQNKSLDVIYLIQKIYYAICILLLFASIIYSKNGITKENDNIEIINISNLRITSLIEVYLNVREIYDQIIYERNYNWITNKNLLNHVKIGIERLNDSCSNLHTLNNQLRNRIYQMAPKIQNSLYEKVAIFNSNTKTENMKEYQEINSFDAGTNIVSSCIKISKSSLDNLQVNDYDMQFILKNSLNDMYIKFDESTNLIVQNANMKIIEVTNNNLILLIIIILFSMLFFILLMKHIMKFNHKREYLFKMLLKIEVEEFQILLIKIQKFFNILSKNYQNKALFIYCNQIQKESRKNKNTRNDNKKKSRSARFGKLNSKNYFLLLLALFLLGAGILIYSTVLIVIQTFQKYELDRYNKMDFIQDSLNYNAIGIAFVNEYISENKTSTILNEDISSVFNKVIYRLRNSLQFITMLSGNNGIIDADFSEFLTGNLCNALTDLQKELCTSLPNSAQMGIISVNNFIFKNLEAIALGYRDSNQTEDVIRHVLSSKSFFEILVIYEVYAKPTYQLMNEIIYNELIYKVNNIQSIIILLGLVIGIAMLIIAIMMRYNIINVMKEQANNLKGLLRLLPINMILNNYSLKMYFIETSKFILEPIKRYLQ